VTVVINTYYRSRFTCGDLIKCAISSNNCIAKSTHKYSYNSVNFIVLVGQSVEVTVLL